MKMKAAATLQDRAGTAMFMVFIFSTLFSSAAMGLYILYSSHLGDSPAAPPLYLALAAYLAVLFVAAWLAHRLCWRQAAEIAAPLVQLEEKLHSLIQAGSEQIIHTGLVVESDLEEVQRLAGATNDLIDRIRFMGMHDPLTGIFNRTYFEQEMQRLASIGDETVGFIMCDLDNLKITNDTLGHKAGDFLLCTAAMIIQRAVREDDVVARIGGDEFVIIVKECQEEDLEGVIERIQDRIKSFNIRNGKIQLGMSLGYAYGHLSEYEAAELLKEADNQMYLDKGTVLQGVLPLDHNERPVRRGSRKRDLMPETLSEKGVLDSIHLF